MRRAELANNLAQSLAKAEWRADALARVLVARLPPRMRRRAAPLAEALIAALPGPYAPAPARIAAALIPTPGLAAVHRHCQRQESWPSPDLTPPVMRPIAAFAGLALPALATPVDLADWLVIPTGRLNYLADVAGRAEASEERRINHYLYQLHKKRQGGMRLIEAPKPGLKAVQRQILTGILNLVPTHDDAFGFVPGRDCLSAAQRHAGEEAVICLDLKDFFLSVPAARIHGLFRCLGYPHAVTRLLTGLTTNRVPPWMRARMEPADDMTLRGPHLPQGAPSSPALANLAAFGLDRRLRGLARSLGMTYTRYADDLSFSGDRRQAGRLARAAVEIIRDEGFETNPAKTRIQGAGARQVVTGLVVNRHLNIPRAEYDLLKATLHRLAQPRDRRLADPRYRAALEGRIGWVERVNPRRGARLRALWERALATDG